jgi:glycosyltransferase involved in cell wall biosynthesis
MPTRDRRAFVPQAVRYFLRQDYPHRELVVVDDGADPVADLLPEDPRIRYVRLDSRHSVGAKRNLACEAARGDLLAHWDDDDWMASDRLTRQVAALAAATGGRVRDTPAACGLARLPFVDPARGLCWEYAHEGSARPWVAGGTLCYTRALWARHPFADVREGEDTRFVWGLRDTPVVAMEGAGPPFYVALVHARNTSPKRTDGARWRPRPLDDARRLLGDDWAFYERLAASGAGGGA